MRSCAAAVGTAWLLLSDLRRRDVALAQISLTIACPNCQSTSFVSRPSVVEDVWQRVDGSRRSGPHAKKNGSPGEKLPYSTARRARASRNGLRKSPSSPSACTGDMRLRGLSWRTNRVAAAPSKSDALRTWRHGLLPRGRGSKLTICRHNKLGLSR